MFAAIAGLGTQALGGIVGSILGAHAANKAKKELNRREQENRTWRNRNYNASALERGDYVQALTKMQDAARARMSAVNGSSAVRGGSGLSGAAERQATNAAVAQVASNAVAQNERRRDQIDREYRQEKERIERERARLRGQQMASIAQAGTGMAQAGASLAALSSGGRGSSSSGSSSGSVKIPENAGEAALSDARQAWYNRYGYGNS